MKEVLQKKALLLAGQSIVAKQHKKISAEHTSAIVQSKSPGTPFTPRLQKEGVEEALLLSQVWERTGAELTWQQPLLFASF